jgi:pilus assembly protein FimV
MGSSKQVITTNFKVKAISALMVSVWGLPTFALELGRLQLQSAIGEPLRAEIEITKVLPEELKSLRVQLASPESFRKVGMEFNPALRGATATLRTGANGKSVISLNGTTPVQDNFIDLVIESQWATGNVVKNYAVLLNSVSDKSSASAGPALQLPVTGNAPDAAANRLTASSSRLNPSSVELNAQKVPVYRFEPVDSRPASATPAPAPAPAPARPASLASSMANSVESAPAVQARPKAIPNNQEGDRVLVMPGDTASRLAIRHLTANISLDQMLLAMLKANPEAFIEDNVNLIKAGASLRIPTPDEAAQISRGEARQTVIAQTRDFAEYARRLAQSPMVIGSRNTREMMGKVGVDVQNVDGQSPQQDKLTLSKSQVKTDSAEAMLAAQRESADKASQLESLNQNLKDLEALASGKTPAAADLPAAAPQGASTSVVAAPAPDASEPNLFSSILEKTQQNKDIWLWAAALLTLMLLLVLWIRKKTEPQEDVFAPSYNDITESAIEPSSTPAPADPVIPVQMSSIDLNLNPMTAAPSPASVPVTAPAAANEVDETENNKLSLAQQLLSKGDHDLARALILSVASSAKGDLKSRALQMLGQIR